MLSFVLVQHLAELCVVDSPGFVLVELGKRCLHLLPGHVGTNSLELGLGDESVAVLVDGFEGQLRSAFVTTKLFKTHRSIHVSILLAENVNHIAPANRTSFSQFLRNIDCIDLKYIIIYPTSLNLKKIRLKSYVNSLANLTTLMRYT